MIADCIECFHNSAPQGTNRKMTTKIVPFPALRSISLRIKDKYMNKTSVDVDVEV